MNSVTYISMYLSAMKSSNVSLCEGLKSFVYVRGYIEEGGEVIPSKGTVLSTGCRTL